MYSFKSAIELLGDKAQVGVGRIIVFDRKHIDIGRIDPGNGAFNLTAEGLAYLDALSKAKAAPVEVQEEAPAAPVKATPKGKAKAEPAATSFDDLDLE